MTAPALNGSAPASTAHAGAASVLDQLFSSVWGGSNAPVEYCPRAGQMVLFPSWLQHSVRPYREQNQRNGGGKSQRMSVSFNAVLEEIDGHGKVHHATKWPQVRLSHIQGIIQVVYLGGDATRRPNNVAVHTAYAG